MEIKAYAKINIALYVGEKRPDGYHEIDSVMQSISLYDTVSIEKAQGITVTCSDPALSGEDNLAARAAELFFEMSGISGGADIYIEKNIPYPAGLGGGSSDAAAVLKGLNCLYNAGLSLEELECAAVRLGADVPFFIMGGTQRAQGIGERLTVLPPLQKGFIVIAMNGQKPSTGEMYKRLDSEPRAEINIDSAVEAVTAGNLVRLAECADNSFARVTGLYGIDGILQSTAPLCVCLSGSGPAVFALYDDETSAKFGLEVLKQKGIECYLAKPIE